MILISAEGQIIAYNKGPARFMQSLVIDKGTLPAGEYHLVVDAAWNFVSSFGMDFKNMTLDVYCPGQVSIEASPKEQGIKHLIRGIKHFAIKNGKKDYFLKEPEVADSIFRIKQVYAFNNWYGFMYLSNNSSHLLKQTYDFKIKGIDVIYHETKNKQYKLSLNSGHDQVFILKRTDQECSFNTSI